MKLNKIYSAILLSSLPLTAVNAGGLDRSGQSIQAFYSLETILRQVFLSLILMFQVLTQMGMLLVIWLVTTISHQRL